MTWRIATRHSSVYHYSLAVAASYNEARMTPVSSDRQVVLETGLLVEPTSVLLRYVDYWSSVVHAFDIHERHDRLEVVSHSVVETTEPVAITTSPSWDDLQDPTTKDRFVEFLTPTASTEGDDELADIAHELAKDLAPHLAAKSIINWVHESMRYETGSTKVSTTALEAWRQGSGVCQDFAHLSIVALRQLGIPARYTSGYFHPSPDAGPVPVEGDSHAWVEAWLGAWHPFDPTNLDPVGERHVTVAHGRDYADVAPLLGVYHGGLLDQLEVSVELARLA